MIKPITNSPANLNGQTFVVGAAHAANMALPQWG